MNSSITTSKCKDTPDQTNKKRQAVRRPVPLVVKLRKDVPGRADLCQRHEWDHHGEEAQDVYDENQALEPGEHAAADDVDSHGEGDHGPVVHCRVPGRGDVVWVREDGDSLDHGAC